MASTQSSDLSIGPAYSGTSSQGRAPLGCVSQVRRAETGVNFGELEHNEAPFSVHTETFRDVPTSASGPGCRCRIAENGCIDSSLCFEGHSLASIPKLTRWYTASIKRIHGAHYLQGWSGWAAPAVMKLLGREPTRERILELWNRSERNTRHDSRVTATLHYTAACGTNVFTFEIAHHSDKEKPKFKQWLHGLPRGTRIG